MADFLDYNDVSMEYRGAMVRKSMKNLTKIETFCKIT